MAQVDLFAHLPNRIRRAAGVPRGHSFYRDDVDMRVFYFADQVHAAKFLARFGGTLIEPKDRPKWPGSRK